MLFLSLLLACAEDPSKDKAKAEVADVPAAPAAPADPAAAPAPVSYEAPAITAPVVKDVDAGRSHITAIGAKITAQHPIVFKDFAGRVGLDGDKVTAVAFTVKMETLEADIPKLSKHLKNEDFFDVAKFPTSTFTSTELVADGAGQKVTGDLTIHGVTKRVSFPATITVTPTEVTAKAEFGIDRKDFGVVYPGKPDDLVQDNVLMKIDLIAAR